ncbi:MAG: hypothetical protein RL562_3461, partial [Planctomycetota bacterium]
ESSVAIREDNWTAQAFLAELAVSTGDAQAAVRHADAALALNPLAYPALRARPRALLALGRIDEAIPAAGTALLRDTSGEATRTMFVEVLAASLRSFEPERAAAVAKQVFAQIPRELAEPLGASLLASLPDDARRRAVPTALGRP